MLLVVVALSLLQTIKEDNKELMLRMKNLLKVKGQLRRDFKEMKEIHLVTRESLAAAMTKCVRWCSGAPRSRNYVVCVVCVCVLCVHFCVVCCVLCMCVVVVWVNFF